MKDLTIQIPDMQSSHCQSRVSNAINTLKGVYIQNLKAGEITVSLDSDLQAEQVLQVINQAGYSTSIENSNAATCSTGCCGK